MDQTPCSKRSSSRRAAFERKGRHLRTEALMSGSGGGGDWRPEAKPVSKPKGQGDGGGGEVPPDPCNITEVTTLNSVNRTVIAGLRPGDRLDVIFQAGPRNAWSHRRPSVPLPGRSHRRRCCSSYNASRPECLTPLRCFRSAERSAKCGSSLNECNYRHRWRLPRAVHLARLGSSIWIRRSGSRCSLSARRSGDVASLRTRRYR